MLDNDPLTTDTGHDSFDQLWLTRDGMRRARWIVGPRDNFAWTHDDTRQGQQYRRLRLLLDDRPVGHAVAVDARWICACGAHGEWRRDQLAVSHDAEIHRLRHVLDTCDNR